MALTPEYFKSLLAALGPDRDAAGDRYETLRRRLLIFFAARNAGPAEDLADEVLDRASRRLSDGVAPQSSIESYLLGIARNVAREEWKRPRAAAVDWAQLAAEPAAAETDPRTGCLEECLRELAPKSRDWVERFYAHQGAEKIRVRQTLAAELEIDSNALRVRLHRIRAKLASCVMECLRRNENAGKTIYERE